MYSVHTHREHDVEARDGVPLGLEGAVQSVVHTRNEALQFAAPGSLVEHEQDDKGHAGCLAHE